MDETLTENHITSTTLVKEAIKDREGGSETYIDSYLRSPQITETTFANALPKAEGLAIGEYNLGRGAISTILEGTVRGGIDGLRGHPTTEEEIKVAVKVPDVKSAHSNSNILCTIEEEYTLKLIRQKQQELYPDTNPFVVDSILIQDFRGAPALIMEYVDRQNQFFSQKELTPEEVRSAISQYFKLQKVIHEAGLTCGDVKAGDIFYKANEDRLIVLDWNVTKPINIPPTSKDMARINADFIYGVGMFTVNLKGRLPEEGLKKLTNLLNDLQAKIETGPYDIEEVLKIVETLPL